jgi:Protein of unknown function (DUF2878)
MVAPWLPAATPGPELPRRRLVINFIVFQAAWFACLYAAAHGQPLWGTACLVAVMAWHLASAARPADEAKLMGCALLIGTVFDSLVVQQQAIQYVSGQFDARVAPHWIIALWGLFAITLNVSLRWLKGRNALAALLGAIAAPLSYAGGVRMGAARFIDAPRALVMLAIGWALLMPLLMALSNRFDGIRPDAGRNRHE